MALSQTLLLRIFPKHQSMQAMGLWAMTTLLAPVVGPVFGGWLCDQYSWGWVFLINVPMALLFGVLAWFMLKRYHEPAVSETRRQGRHAALDRLGGGAADHAR